MLLIDSRESLRFLLGLLTCGFGRSSVDEEVARLDDGRWDDDILANSSDEEEDSSSVSSKGEVERPEESRVRSRPAYAVVHCGEFDAFPSPILASFIRHGRDRRVRSATSPLRL